MADTAEHGKLADRKFVHDEGTRISKAPEDACGTR